MTDDHTTDTEQEDINEQLDTLAERIANIREQADPQFSEAKQELPEWVQTPELSDETNEPAADEVTSDHDAGEPGGPTTVDGNRQDTQKHAPETSSTTSVEKTISEEVGTKSSATQEQSQAKMNSKKPATDDTPTETNTITGEEGTTQASQPIHPEISAKEIHSLLTAVDQFVDTIRLFKNQIGLFEERIESNTNNINSIENVSVDITDQMSNLVELIDIQDEELSEIKRKITQYREAVTEQSQNVEDLQSGVESNRTTISDIRDDNIEFREKLTDIRDELLDTQQSLGALQQNAEDVDAELSELHTKDDQLQTQLETHDQAVKELATDLDEIETDITSLRNRTVTVDGEDLLIRAAIRELSRQQLSTKEVESIANQEVTETMTDVRQQLTDVQSLMEEIITREETRKNTTSEITSLRREVQSLKQNTDTDATDEESNLAEPGQSELRQNVRELQRENRAIKELIDGLNQNGQ